MISNDDKFVICNNCNIKIDCDNRHIFCLYLGNQSNPEEELIICEDCNFDLKSNFQEKGYNCDDWDLEDSEDIEIENNQNNKILLEDEEDSKMIRLCKNEDCERYPPDWDFEEDIEENYGYGCGRQWVKCCLCDGYYNDDGLGDILFVQEEPNNQEAGCDLCGKDNNIVQMKGTGEYLCGNGCDESDEDSD
jgi:hypothetical protein